MKAKTKKPRPPKCPDCGGRLVLSIPLLTDWYGVLQWGRCVGCKERWVRADKGEWEVAA